MKKAGDESPAALPAKRQLSIWRGIQNELAARPSMKKAGASSRYQGTLLYVVSLLLLPMSCQVRISAAAFRGETLGDVLADAEDVAVGVFEPGDLAAVGGGPDAEGLVLGEGILFRGDAAVLEPGGGGLNVFNLPSEDGALQWSEIGDLNDANHVAADAHDQRKFVETYKLEAELAFVKAARFVVIRRGDKADHLS